MILRLTAVFVFLAACSSTVEVVADPGVADEPVVDGEPVEEEPVVMEQCDAEDYRPLIGTVVAGATLSDGPMLRVYAEGDIITQEYLPRRTNIVHDARQIIRNVYCG